MSNEKHSYALEMKSIQKRFGGVPALSGANLFVRPGEVHGLVGENGAGKSTLINIATGVLHPDGGEQWVNGALVRPQSPRQAATLGIAVVHQESELFAQLSVAENMLMGQGLVKNRLGLIDWRGTRAAANAMLGRMGESMNVGDTALGLPIARRMMSEIAAAVSQEARILFLDEPTASLTLKEIENLFTRIRQLRDAGVSIIYVSHRLEEVLELCDRVTVMRDGATVDSRPMAEWTMDTLVAAMVGREVGRLGERVVREAGPVLFEVANLTDRSDAFRGLTFEVRAGEVLGVYGFVGAGRSEFAQSLFGLRSGLSGLVKIDGKPVRARSPRAAMRAGMAYLPEDRLVQGVFRAHSLRSNASVARLPALSVATLISKRRENSLVRGVMESTNVKATSAEQAIGTLSGGNQQKVVFGRWQATSPKVFLLDEPTRGVDVGAKAEIYKLINDLAASGTAVVMISSDLPEVMAMSDRVAVLSEGSLTGIFDPTRDTEQDIAAAAVPRSSERTAPKPGVWGCVAGGLMRFREAGLLAIIIVLFLSMVIARPGVFLSANTFFDILASAALPAIVAQGALLIICTGGIDISVGSMLGLLSAIACAASKAGWPPWACLALAMAGGVVFSLANGGVSRLWRIHPIIVTLAGLSIYRGFQQIQLGGRDIQNLDPAFRALGDGFLLGIPRVCYYAVVVTLLVHLLLRYTLTGRRILAVGDSESAARLIGISMTRLTLLVFGISGALVGLAAVLNAGYFGNVAANTGMGMELKAIAAAVIGGANILGGRGSAPGALLGAFLVALVYTMLVQLGVSSFWQDLFVGGLILLTVVVDVLVQRARGARS